MRKFLAVVLCLATVPAAADSLQGHWNITVPKHPAYVGTVLIDSQRRATWDAPVDNGRPARYLGYVSEADSMKLKILLTNRYAVIKCDCSIMSSDLLYCVNTGPQGHKSAPIILTRVGPGPRVLQAASR